MGMSGTAGNAVGKRRHRRHAVMSEINVTPMVDVMLVLLIVFMVSAPLLTVGVPVELPETRARARGAGGPRGGGMGGRRSVPRWDVLLRLLRTGGRRGGSFSCLVSLSLL